MIDGGPAFGHGAENGHCCGASLRDYFAAMAMQGLLAAHAELWKTYPGGVNTSVFAGAWKCADAMLQAREREIESGHLPRNSE